MKVCVRKTNEELAKVKKEIIEIIDNIERTKDFPPTKSQLCYWCEYMDICPAWNKTYKREKQEELKLDEEQIEKKLDL